jgi:hypothetical protein
MKKSVNQEVMVKIFEETAFRACGLCKVVLFCYIIISTTIASNDCNVKFFKKMLKKLAVVKPQVKVPESPPVGPALGAAGVNIMEFCNNLMLELKINLQNMPSTNYCV